LVSGSISLHNPKGSNNRCDELTDYVNNNNRLFHSNNYVHSGYSIPCKKPYNVSSTNVECYNMKYYENTNLILYWTNNVNCIQNNCVYIIQYLCSNDLLDGKPVNGQGSTCVNTQSYTLNPNLGQHESFNYYNICKHTERNKGLKYNVLNNTSIFSKNNINGDRYGFECPEERDYYPYWHHSSWIDIAVLTTNDDCDYYNKHSECNENRYDCYNYTSKIKNISKEKCIKDNGKWEKVRRNKCNIKCKKINNMSSLNNYIWKIPKFNQYNKCVIRIRLNVTSVSLNAIEGIKKLSYILNVSEVPVHIGFNKKNNWKVYQDRTFLFYILEKPYYIDEEIFNVNIIGKRGNDLKIQGIPSIQGIQEYNFFPSELNTTLNSYINFQWDGSDFNPINSVGNGRIGTDRNNMIQLLDKKRFFENKKTEKYFISQGQDIHNRSKCYSYNELLLLYSDEEKEEKEKNCAILNSANPYFNYFPIQINKTGKFNFISSRTNAIFTLYVNDGEKEKDKIWDIIRSLLSYLFTLFIVIFVGILTKKNIKIN